MNTSYTEIAAKLKALMEGVPYQTANLANAAALLWLELPDINWVGFYQLMGDGLVLGPFQGKPACIRIPLGKGVCGKAAAEKRTIRVENVHEFPGHIACDSASNSELVLPLYRREKLWGVLDIDSPLLSRFTPAEEQDLTAIAEELSRMLSETE